MTLLEAVDLLLAGKTLSWASFGDHQGGSIRLDTPGTRRLFDFLKKQPSERVALGSEALIQGLIDAWKAEDSDPAREVSTQAAAAIGGPWRLHRIEATNFGGLTRFGGPVFDLPVEGHNWCLEGQNGSGKTALANSVIWALTGQRVRDDAGPIDDNGERVPVFDDHGNEIGTWPALVSYPSERAHLRVDAEASVRLTFVNPDGEIAEVFRHLTSPQHGLPRTEVQIDPRLRAASAFIEPGILMPARLSHMNFADRSQSLFDAVKRLTGLDPLADIAQGVSQYFTHGARKFLKYAKEQGSDRERKTFDEAIQYATENCNDLGLDVAPVSTIDAKDLDARLEELIKASSAEASTQLAVLKAEVSSELDLSKPADREKVREAVTTLKLLTEHKTGPIAIFEAWSALAEVAKSESFQRLPDMIVQAERELAIALLWHQRQLDDHKLRLKALAAQWFVTAADPACPLCEGELKTPHQQQIARELAELHGVAAEAERKLEEVCAGIETRLRKLLPDAISSRLKALQEMEPRSAYAKTMRERLVETTPFVDVLTGCAASTRQILSEQETALPRFEFNTTTAANTGEPNESLELRLFMSGLHRLVALVQWWTTHREVFQRTYAELRGRIPTAEAHPAEGSLRGQVRRLEQALAKANPYDAIAKRLTQARAAAKTWHEIMQEQRVREAIKEALLPLKDLRLLVEAETARSIAALSGRIERVLKQIHLRERLTYRGTGLKKKGITVQGALTAGMKIDATLIANTSWLRAILWAFILALREETARVFGSNPLPLLLLDDPQIAFDPRNKLKWAEALADLANLDRNEATGAQLFLTTHEHEFFMLLTEREKVQGEHGLIAPADPTYQVASVMGGGCLRRRWRAADEANDDEKARDYISHVRIHAEKFMKIILRSESPDIQSGNLEKLRNELERLAKDHVRPYDGTVFAELLRCIQKTNKPVKLLNEPPHSDAETLGVAQAEDVHKFWETSLEPKLLAALRSCQEYASYHGDSRTFIHEPTVVAFPTDQHAEFKKAKLILTGIAAAAKTDGRAGDGLLTLDEWEEARANTITLHNHGVYRLTAATLEPVAALGAMVIVSNYAKVTSSSIVLVAHGDRLLARRYNEMSGHAEIVVLTGQAINPHELVEPIIVRQEGLEAKKVVGTIFTRTVSPLRTAGKNEFTGVDDIAKYWSTVNGSRLFKIHGRSAEPIALDGQYLMTHEPLSPQQAMRDLDGQLVVAVDEDGTKYFKRLRRTSKSFVILESINADAAFPPELLGLGEETAFPRLARLLPVVGVLFELPGS